MNRIRDFINKIVEILSCGVLGIMTVLVTWQVITRFIFKSPSTITEALAKYLFLWLVLIASAYVVGQRGHMAIEFLIIKLNKKAQCIVGAITELVIFLFSLIVMTYGGGYIALHAMNQMDSALPIPIGIVYLALPVGGVLMAFYSFTNIINLISNLKNKDNE